MCGLRAETGSCTVGCVQLSARAQRFNRALSPHSFTLQLPDMHKQKKNFMCKLERTQNIFVSMLVRCVDGK